MNIAVLGINYYPEVTGIAVYTTDMCEYLVSKGSKVTAFTSFPYYPFGSDFSWWYKKMGVKYGSLFFDEEISGVKVIRCNRYNPKRPNAIKRFLHESSFTLLMLIKTLSSHERYDLIIYVSPPFLLGFVAIIFSRIKKTPYILHVQDMVIDAAKELGMIKNKAILSILDGVERYVYKNADFITTISESMRQKIIEKRVEQGKVGLLFNWADACKIVPIDRKNPFSHKNGLDDKFVVMHAGNMGEKQDLDIVLEAAKAMINDRSVLFLLVGRGSKRVAVERYIRENRLTNVSIMDIQPEETMNELFSSCDIALITQNKKLTDCVMPSKVFGPACAEKPIIIAARESCEICRIVRANGFGVIVTAGDAEALVEAIYRIKDDMALAEIMGKSGRNFMLQNRDMKKILGDFEQKIIMRYVRA